MLEGVDTIEKVGDGAQDTEEQTSLIVPQPPKTAVSLLNPDPEMNEWMNVMLKSDRVKVKVQVGSK